MKILTYSPWLMENATFSRLSYYVEGQLESRTYYSIYTDIRHSVEPIRNAIIGELNE